MRVLAGLFVCATTVALGGVSGSSARGVRTVERTPRGVRTVGRIPGFTLDEAELSAVYERGRLRLTVPYRCTRGCGGRLVASLRTLRGAAVATRTARRLGRSGKPPTVRLSFPLRMRTRQVELLVLRLSYRKGGLRVLWTVALARILDGPRIRVLGQSRVHAGSRAALRVLVLQGRAGLPLPGAACTATLSGPSMQTQVHQGRSGPGGAFRPVFDIPLRMAGRALRLVISARSSRGDRELRTSLRVQRKVQVLLTLDKPIYQPGQTIHLRALTLASPSGNALAGAPMTFQIRDGRGNLVHRRVVRNDRFGVAHTRFRLADRINQGRYRVTAEVTAQGSDPVRTARTVRVFSYRLPTFRIRTRFDQAYYKPGQTVSGEVYAWYVFGKPVVDGPVVLRAALKDLSTTRIARITGRTNRWGAFRFRFRLPDDFVGKPFLQGSGEAQLEAQVSAPGGEQRLGRAAVPVVSSAIQVTLVPESGTLERGLDQRVHVVTTLPDGSPVAASLQVNIEQSGGARRLVRIRTDAQGIGALDVRPEGRRLRISAVALDRQGRVGLAKQQLTVRSSSEALLVRPDRALYRAGERMVVSILSSRPTGHVYLDVIRAGQTRSTHAVRLSGGRARLVLPLSVGDHGLLLLSAYRFDRRGDMVADVRPVLVQRSSDLRVRLTADREVYRPGQPATLRFEVTDSLGQPVVAALGVWIIDSAVYALSESRPALARAFFRLQGALLGRAVVPGLAPERLLRRTEARQWARQVRAANVLLSAASSGYHYSLHVDGHEQHQRAVSRRVARAARPRVRRIGWQIAYAVRRYFRRQSCADDAPSLRELVRGRFLSEYQLLDPWGEPVSLEGSKGEGSRWVTLTVTSAGPDELGATDDDVSERIRFRLRRCVPPHVERALGVLYSMNAGGLGGFRGFGRGGGGGAPRVFMSRARVMGSMSFSARRRVRYPMSLRSSLSPARVDASGREPVRVRKHFPEALAVRPALITDSNGQATMSLRMADSITTWRLAALASTPAGQLGSVERDLRVFTKFFVELRVPRELTRGDRITIPVILHNYQPTAEHVRVTLQPAGWYRIVGGSAERAVRMAPRSVATTSFVILAHRVGSGRIRVVARGAKVSDAVERPVAVRPDGDRVDFGKAGALQAALLASINVPPTAVPGSQAVTVQVSPGALSAAVDGLDAMLREPHGCFEQTSSTTYPNVMILRYLRTQRRRAPTHAALAARARRLIGLGYQRLVTFETRRGGFSLFGGNPADTMLTAYGLHEFVDMAAVHPVARPLIRRTRRFLAAAQDHDGSWNPRPSYFFSGRPSQADWVRGTAYVAWALWRAGERGRVIRRALRFLEHQSSGVTDPYTLGVVASLLVSINQRHPKLPGVLAKLVAQRVRRNQTTYWRLGAGGTLTRSGGEAANVETTALAAWVLLRARRHLGVASRALRYLSSAKSPRGGWGSTQANVLAIRALLEGQSYGAVDARGTAEIAVDGRVVGRLALAAGNAGVVQAVDLSRFVRSGRRHRVSVRFTGKGNPVAELRGSYHLPYGTAPRAGLPTPLRLSVSYSRKTLPRRGMVTARVVLRNTSRLSAASPMITVGRPAGFEPQLDDLRRLVQQRRIARFEVRARRLVIYLQTLGSRKTLAFGVRFRAQVPLRVTAPPSTAYEYYVADVKSRTGPTVLTVR
ncbi:MAG: MG2 domain-containing protein [bacterium]